MRDTGIRSAMYGRVFFVALGLVGAVGAAAIYGVGGHLVVSGDISSGTLVALAALATRVYSPLTGLTNARVDLMTSLVSFERVFEVLDAPDPITERPGAVDLVAPAAASRSSSVRFRYPPADETRIGSLEQHPPSADPDRDVLDGVDLDVLPGRDRRPRGRVGRRQVDAGLVDPPALRRDGGARCSSTGTTCAT